MVSTKFSVTDSLILSFIEQSKDGYAIYSAEDTLIYCNEAYADVLSLPLDLLYQLNFEALIRYCDEVAIGIKVDTDDIDAFMQHVRKVRRSTPFRMFEGDFHDGRWFLVSEQTNEDQEILLQLKDITEQKFLERNLERSVHTLNELALTDELTHAFNRRGFFQSVETDLERCQRNGDGVSLAILDLDLFKRVNDCFGHLAGDTALVHVADLVRNCLRPYDVFGRIGGEEFAILLSKTTPQSAFEICERIRKQIAVTPLLYEQQSIDLSVSIGLTSGSANVSLNQLYTQADRAMYAAKTDGRNVVKVFQGN